VTYVTITSLNVQFSDRRRCCCGGVAFKGAFAPLNLGEIILAPSLRRSDSVVVRTFDESINENLLILAEPYETDVSRFTVGSGL